MNPMPDDAPAPRSPSSIQRKRNEPSTSFNLVLVYLYLIVFIGVSVAALLVVWPSRPSEFGAAGQRLSAEMRQLLLVCAGAVLGTSMATMRTLTESVGSRAPMTRSLWTYALDVLLAIPLSLTLYVIMRGLILSPSAGVEHLNPSGVLVLSLLVGMQGPGWLLLTTERLAAKRNTVHDAQLERISTALGVATLDNYHGYACVSIETESGEPVERSDGQYVVTPDRTYRLKTWFEPSARDDVASQAIDLRGGMDVGGVQFTLSADTDVGRLDRRTDSVSFSVNEASADVIFVLKDLVPKTSGKVFVEVVQKNRLVEVVVVPVTVAGPIN